MAAIATRTAKNRVFAIASSIKAMLIECKHAKDIVPLIADFR